jgi:hypothetical protein
MKVDFSSEAWAHRFWWPIDDSEDFDEALTALSNGDYLTAADILKTLARRPLLVSGSIPVRYTRGMMCVHDEGEPRDYAAAMSFWLPLAMEGFAPAQHNIAVMYDEGLGVEKDHAKAAEWRRKAAAQGVR